MSRGARLHAKRPAAAGGKPAAAVPARSRSAGAQAGLLGQALPAEPGRRAAGRGGNASTFRFGTLPLYAPGAPAPQAKLKVSRPGDKYEQEADRVADSVMRMPEPQAAPGVADGGRLQRQPVEEELQLRRQPDEEEEVLQGKFTNTESPAQFQSNGDEAANRTGMPNQLKTGLEQLSGMDLSRIRVHNNSSKPAQLNALAYTQGQDIHVGMGQEKHLPHEGWHVVQQMQGRVNPTMHEKGVSINDDAVLEREADVMGAKALRMTRGPIIQRQGPRMIRKSHVVQKIHPALAAIGAWMTAEGTVAAASTVGAAIALGHTAIVVGSYIAPDSDGVQTVQLGRYMSRQDQKTSEEILKYWFINEAADELTKHYSLSEVNEAIVKAVMGLVRDRVEKRFINILNKNEKSPRSSRSFIWSDSGSHTADIFGTVGSIKFINLKGSHLATMLKQNRNAKKLGIKLEPMWAQIHQVRGGHMVKGDHWDIGWFDSLGINQLGEPEPNDSFGKHGLKHGALTVNTQWRWDNNETQWSFDVYTLIDTFVDAQDSIGTPED